MPVIAARVPFRETADCCGRGDTSERTGRGRAGRPFAANCPRSHFPAGPDCVED